MRARAWSCAAVVLSLAALGCGGGVDEEKQPTAPPARPVAAPPRNPTPADVTHAKATTRQFLRGWLAYIDGRVSLDRVSGATPELLKGQPARMPRTAPGRATVSAVKLDQATSGLISVTATIDDARAPRSFDDLSDDTAPGYTLVLSLRPVDQSWLVNQVDKPGGDPTR